MATPLRIIFSTDENMVAQAHVNFIGTTIKSLVVEFDQVKYEEYLSSSSKSLKAMRNTAIGVRSQVS